MNKVSAKYELGIDDGNYSVIVKTTVGDTETRRVVLKTTNQRFATSLQNELQTAYETGIANGALTQLNELHADLEIQVSTIKEEIAPIADLDEEVARLNASLKPI